MPTYFFLKSRWWFCLCVERCECSYMFVVLVRT